jgi:hypothetical protein
VTAHLNGTDHFREAEEYLEASLHPDDEATKLRLVATAQVHATLALAAATALAPAYGPHVAEGSVAAHWRTILTTTAAPKE